MNILKRFRRTEEAKPQEASRPLLTFYDLDFKYDIVSKKFGNFSYSYNINLPALNEERFSASKNGVEVVTNLLDKIYPHECDFSRTARGDVSVDGRNMEIAYISRKDSLLFPHANIQFHARFDKETISRAYFSLFLYGRDAQEDLLSTHDSILGLSNVQITDKVVSSIAQINKIRNGHGPTVENFLLA